MPSTETLTMEFPPHILMSMECYGDAIEINLVNRRYAQQRTAKVKQILFLLTIYVAYTIWTYTVQLKVARNKLIDFGFLLFLLHLLSCTMDLVKSDKLLYCSDFALQLQTERFLSRRSNVFVSASNIFDVAINEVIEDLDVHYMLIARTKGSLFNEQPIIPIFNTLRPPADCLQVIYTNLRNLLQKNTFAPGIVS